MDLLLEKAPYIGGIIFIVITFIKYMTVRDAQFQEAIKSRDETFHETIKEVVNTHDQREEKTHSIIQDNTTMMGKVHEALNHNTEAFHKLNK